MGTIGDQTKLQIDLDLCTGAYAINLRAAATTMSESYVRINAFRVMAIAACEGIITCPGVAKAADAYLGVEKIIQTIAKKYWDEQQNLWKIPIFSHCNLPLLTQKEDIPDFPFHLIRGDKTDLIDPSSLVPTQEDSILISLNYRNIHSTAEIRNNGGYYDWTVQWIK